MHVLWNTRLQEASRGSFHHSLVPSEAALLLWILKVIYAFY
jgi:hypothetical protein